MDSERMKKVLHEKCKKDYEKFLKAQEGVRKFALQLGALHSELVRLFDIYGFGEIFGGVNLGGGAYLKGYGKQVYFTRDFICYMPADNQCKVLIRPDGSVSVYSILHTEPIYVDLTDADYEWFFVVMMDCRRSSLSGLLRSPEVLRDFYKKATEIVKKLV